jgi:hypothetical protein
MMGQQKVFSLDIQIPQDQETWNHLQSRVPPSRETYAFLYTADIGLKVENVKFGFNPAIPRDELWKSLSPRPGWLRPEWLKEPWPERPKNADRELLIVTLLRLRAFLSMGSVVPDGLTKDLRRGFLELFPEVSGVAEHDTGNFETHPSVVTISARNAEVLTIAPGTSGGRRGVAVPIVLERMFGRRMAVDVYRQKSCGWMSAGVWMRCGSCKYYSGRDNWRTARISVL